MNFLTGSFAFWGLIFATGPILIHLLNRRRFRTVAWAAMDFLRQAMQRNRKVLQLRDLLLLMLRILAIAAFGLALARPFFTRADADLTTRTIWLGLLIVAAFGMALWGVLTVAKRARYVAGIGCLMLIGLIVWEGRSLGQQRAALAGTGQSSRQPVHAILLIDNSQSMAFQTLSGTRLDRAKSRAVAFLEELPPQSRVSIVPGCGSARVITDDAFRSIDAATEAVGQIEVVDRSLSLTDLFGRAIEITETIPELPAKRVVLLSDQQRDNWENVSPDLLAKLPDVQLVQIDEAVTPPNLAVTDLYVPDGIADIETETFFIVGVTNFGPETAKHVQVTLTVGQTPVGTQTVDLEPNQTRELSFSYRIPLPAETDRLRFVIAEASLQTTGPESDALSRDNVRVRSVPVVAALPVVFVDQQGSAETQTERGETYRLRRLLAPRLRDDSGQRQLIRVRHRRFDELDRNTLRDARLTVIAGVPEPTPEGIALLRQYVRQGGQLVIAAGANFDPAKWNAIGYANGSGVLPAPLQSEAVGETPYEANRPEDLSIAKLDFESLRNDYFLLDGESEAYLSDLYESAIFFKYVNASIDETAREAWRETRREELETQRERLLASDEQRLQWTTRERTGGLTAEDEAARQQDETERQRLAPDWWTPAGTEAMTNTADEQKTPIEDVLNRERLQVRARFEETGDPYLVERRLGSGRVLLFTSGLYSPWNTFATGDTLAVFDRISRRLLDATLPTRNFETTSNIVLPANSDRSRSYRLTRPSGFEEDLPIEALDASRFGVVVDQPFDRGRYRVRVTQSDDDREASELLNEYELAINGPAEESDLTAADWETLRGRWQEANTLEADALDHVSWLSEGEPIRVEGGAVIARDLWKTLLMIVLGCLLLEMLVLSRSHWRTSPTPEASR